MTALATDEDGVVGMMRIDRVRVEGWGVLPVKVVSVAVAEFSSASVTLSSRETCRK